MSTADLYLIAHKVRGEPAFDIAQRMEMDEDGEEWWIIPTSGHRAYPYWFVELVGGLAHQPYWDNVPPLPPNWPDHYTTTERREPMIGSLLTKLGLRKPKAPINRRA